MIKPSPNTTQKPHTVSTHGIITLYASLHFSPALHTYRRWCMLHIPSMQSVQSPHVLRVISTRKLFKFYRDRERDRIASHKQTTAEPQNRHRPTPSISYANVTYKYSAYKHTHKHRPHAAKRTIITIIWITRLRMRVVHIQTYLLHAHGCVCGFFAWVLARASALPSRAQRTRPSAS